MHFYHNPTFSSSSQKYLSCLTYPYLHPFHVKHSYSIHIFLDCGLSQAWSAHQEIYSYRKLTPPLSALSIASFPQLGGGTSCPPPLSRQEFTWLEYGLSLKGLVLTVMNIDISSLPLSCFGGQYFSEVI